MLSVIPSKLLRNYKVQFAVLLFLISFTTFHMMKPGFSYLPNGGYRPFGVGYKHKTVVPVWAVAIFLAILSYLFILFLITKA
jgi:hypothetical protein